MFSLLLFHFVKMGILHEEIFSMTWPRIISEASKNIYIFCNWINKLIPWNATMTKDPLEFKNTKKPVYSHSTILCKRIPSSIYQHL